MPYAGTIFALNGDHKMCLQIKFNASPIKFPLAYFIGVKNLHSQRKLYLHESTAIAYTHTHTCIPRMSPVLMCTIILPYNTRFCIA